MRIKFNILWFENEQTWINAKMEDLQDIVVEEHGFEWVQPSIYRTIDDFKGNFDDYDLILMDFKLAEGSTPGKTGSDIIKKIRRMGSFTNILFYSQQGVSKLRAQVADNQLDGVFCARKEEFVTKFGKLFETNIRKVEDINNLRGLVMAETSDLDSLKEEIIDLYDKSSCPKKEKILNAAIKHLKENHSRDAKLFAIVRPTFNHLKGRLDLAKKGMIIHSINNRSTPKICGFEYESFRTKVIRKRNLLAHVKEGRDSKNNVALISRGNTLTFSHGEAAQIRKDILSFKKQLELLKHKLNSC